VEREKLKAIVENLLLASDQAVSPDELQKTIMNGTPKDEIMGVLEELREDYESKNLQVIEVAGGYQLCTRHEYTDWIRKFLKMDKTTKLSQPSLDTLSIVAYKQPITRQEVEDIRGVDSSGVIKTLLEKKIIGPAGRKEVPGRPIMYRTTRKFLEYFGLKDLSDLPTLEDFKEELKAEDEGNAQTQMDFTDESMDDTSVESTPELEASPSSDAVDDSPGQPEVSQAVVEDEPANEINEIEDPPENPADSIEEETNR
jgi:segregation and condensation protein B